MALETKNEAFDDEEVDGDMEAEEDEEEEVEEEAAEDEEMPRETCDGVSGMGRRACDTAGVPTSAEVLVVELEPARESCRRRVRRSVDGEEEEEEVDEEDDDIDDDAGFCSGACCPPCGLFRNGSPNRGGSSIITPAELSFTGRAMLWIRSNPSTLVVEEGSRGTRGPLPLAAAAAATPAPRCLSAPTPTPAKGRVKSPPAPPAPPAPPVAARVSQSACSASERRGSSGGSPAEEDDAVLVENAEVVEVTVDVRASRVSRRG